MTEGVPPVLHVIAGPNGAGKTTFYDLQLSRLTDAEFVNADRLAEAHFGHVAATKAESEQGQNLAQTRREALIEAGESLVMESTFSHPSKIDFVRDALAAGYRVVVYHLTSATPTMRSCGWRRGSPRAVTPPPRTASAPAMCATSP